VAVADLTWDGARDFVVANLIFKEICLLLGTGHGTLPSQLSSVPLNCRRSSDTEPPGSGTLSHLVSRDAAPPQQDGRLAPLRFAA
jgi:hypothetical protein